MTDAFSPDEPNPQTSAGLLFDDPTFDTDVESAAALLEVGRTRLSQMVARGELSYVKRKVGPRLRMFFRRSELLARVATRYQHSFAAHAGLRTPEQSVERPSTGLTPSVDAALDIRMAPLANAGSDHPTRAPAEPRNLPSAARRMRVARPLAKDLEDHEEHKKTQDQILAKLDDLAGRMSTLESLVKQILSDLDQRHIQHRLQGDHVLKSLATIQAIARQSLLETLIHPPALDNEVLAAPKRSLGALNCRRRRRGILGARGPCSVVLKKPKKASKQEKKTR
jgi:hypothetical protein